MHIAIYIAEGKLCIVKQNMEIYGFKGVEAMEIQNFKNKMEPGELYVQLDLTDMLPKWPVDSWDMTEENIIGNCK